MYQCSLQQYAINKFSVVTADAVLCGAANLQLQSVFEIRSTCRLMLMSKLHGCFVAANQKSPYCRFYHVECTILAQRIVKCCS
jgi:hypothetical protein